MRQLAWLRAVPDPPESKSGKAPPIDKRNRLKRMQESGNEPKMPPILAGRRFLDWLFDIGPSTPTGQGVIPLSHSEIRAWQQCSGVQMTRIEAQTLRELSASFVDELISATDPKRPAPYVTDAAAASEKAKQTAAEAMRKAMRAM